MWLPMMIWAGTVIDDDATVGSRRDVGLEHRGTSVGVYAADPQWMALSSARASDSETAIPIASSMRWLAESVPEAPPCMAMPTPCQRARCSR